ncbi:MAG: beta-lactamase family protein, partial [Acidobacteria bacterium]|nr:beta-lactamase family protein [Acidobacteriota bacterium]
MRFILRTPRKNALPLLFSLSLLAGNTAAARGAGGQAAKDSSARGVPLVKELSPARLDALIPRLMREGEVPGLSVAVARGGRVAWRRAYGVKNAETKEPVADDTVFQAGSLTKPVVAYAALKLVDQGRLALDKPLADYLPKLHVEGDERVRLITARHVLSHRTGFPNWRPRGGALQIHFTPGERFSYSGEGFQYLHEVIKHITGEPLQATLEQLVFVPLGMRNSAVVVLERLDAQVANGHTAAGAPLPKPKQTEANAAASLRTTASDYARFVIAVMNGEGLKRETAAEMLRPQVRLGACVNCLSPAPDAAPSDKLAWGLGWGLQRTAEGESFWHWGDNGVFKCYVVAYPKQKSALVVFTNSTHGLSIHHEIIADAVGGEQPGIAWLKYEKYDAPARGLFKSALAKGAGAALA